MFRQHEDGERSLLFLFYPNIILNFFTMRQKREHEQRHIFPVKVNHVTQSGGQGCVQIWINEPESGFLLPTSETAEGFTQHGQKYADSQTLQKVQHIVLFRAAVICCTIPQLFWCHPSIRRGTCRLQTSQRFYGLNVLHVSLKVFKSLKNNQVLLTKQLSN